MRPGFVAREVLPRVFDAGLLLTGAGDRVLRFSPPLVVSLAELKEGLATLRGVLSAVGQAPAKARATA